ncbi:MAG: radical SAM protein [Candidatus Omnitrophica bacterium]|nr:radical SAM protein [Candidatus Omnitrophota bacterium]
MKKDNVVLISLDSSFTFSYALPYLDGYLKKEGIEAKIIFPKIGKLNIRQLVNEILKLDPVIVAMGGLFGDIYEIESIISALEPYRKNFKIVIGGYLVTPIPEFALLKTKADIAVVGEGEIIFANLVKAVLGGNDVRGIKGLAIHDGEKSILTGPGAFIEDLSDLPKINYDKFPLEHFIKIYKFYKIVPHNTIYSSSSRVFWIQTGRGCPFECNFCYHHSKFRLRNIPDVIEEAKELIERYNLNIISFQDDLFAINKKRTLELCNVITKEKLNVKYTVSGHAGILNEEMIKALKESGCIQISLGIESGSQRVLDLIGKGTRIEQINEVMKLIRKYKIDRGVSIQMGQPGETKEEIEKTIALMLNHTDEYTTPSVTMTTPYPGSHLYEYALKIGLLKGPDDLYNRYKGVCNLSVNFTTLEDSKLVEIYHRAARMLIEKKWEALKKHLGRIKFHASLFNYYIYRCECRFRGILQIPLRFLNFIKRLMINLLRKDTLISAIKE